MQLHHKAKSPWNKDERTIAISMFYKSPGLYRFLRKKGNIAINFIYKIVAYNKQNQTRI